MKRIECIKLINEEIGKANQKAIELEEEGDLTSAKALIEAMKPAKERLAKLQREDLQDWGDKAAELTKKFEQKHKMLKVQMDKTLKATAGAKGLVKGVGVLGDLIGKLLDTVS